jgi:hypothetical protein
MTFSELEGEAETLLPRLAARIEQRLAGELDAAALARIRRRFLELDAGLASLSLGEARILRVGLVFRMAEVLERAHRRRSRVRDLIDFYFCRGATLRHRRPGQASVFEAARSLRWRALGSGVWGATLRGRFREGPLTVRLLRLRDHRFEPLLFAEGCADLPRLASERGARVATSSGYILASEMDIEAPSRAGDPVGLLAAQGEVINPPTFPRAALLDGPGGLSIRRVGPVGFALSVGGRRFEIEGLNESEGLGRRVLAFNRIWGRGPPSSPEGAPIRVLTLLGRHLLAVDGQSEGPEEVPLIPKAGLALALPAEALSFEEAHGRIGQELRFAAPFELRAAAAAESFTPEVPPYTFSADETFGLNQLPRMAAGLRPNGDLLLAAVDGRNFACSVGMTLGQCSGLVAALGCDRALNLDGGDSKRMTIDGLVLDRPGCELEWDPSPDTDTSAPIRPVYSALLWRPR